MSLYYNMIKTFKDKEIVDLLLKKEEYVKGGREINKKIEALQEELSKGGHKVQRIKDKIKPLFDKYQETLELKEFDVVTRMFIDEEHKEKGEFGVEIVDRIEEIKKSIRQSALEELKVREEMEAKVKDEENKRLS